jgi:hypothetical protein
MRAIIISRIILTVAACAALFFLRCANLSGGGSEAGNARITGRVLDTLGSPAGNVVVTVLPSGFDPVKKTPLHGAYFDTTGTDGTFGITVQKDRTYTIQAVHSNVRTRALLAGVAVGDTDLTVPQCTLNAPGTIRVKLQDGADKTLGYVYVPGTTVLASPNNTDSFAVLDSVPAGVIPAVSYSSKVISSSTVIRYDVQVTPGDTTFVYNPSWQYARRLFLNTTASGANVSGDVYDFPVLVRLTAGNFTFAQAKVDGADIRFTKHDHTFLPYEIERWDPVTGLAEVWVKVDTIFGNDRAQSIMMFWGNPDTSNSSNSAAVFDTADGFAGVWHLGENVDSIYDATGNAFNGKKYGSTTVPGMIGNSKSFANGNYIRISGLLKSPSNVTLSAWVQYDTASGGQDIVSIGDAVFIRVDDIINDIGTTGSYHNDPVVNDSNYAYVSSGRFLAKTGWHYLVFSINTPTHVQTLYIDGAQCAISHDINPIYYTGLGADTYIGMHGNGKTRFNFIGQIDEVRVHNSSLAPDWVKLCFMNQKARDALIVW